MIIAGIDPGQTGSLAIMFPDGSGVIDDVPMQTLRGKKSPAWAEWWSNWSRTIDMAEPDFFVIEQVASRPQQGVASVFKFGRAFGFVHAIAAARGVPVHFETPNVWKRKMGLLNSDKNASRELVRQLFPGMASRVERVKDDGRAEAILLAEYGRRTFL